MFPNGKYLDVHVYECMCPKYIVAIFIAENPYRTIPTAIGIGPMYFIRNPITPEKPNTI